MLAVVCKSYDAARALEQYERNGEVDCKLGLHAEATALGKSISGRFLAVCLEDIRYCIIVIGLEMLMVIVTTILIDIED